MTLTLPLTLNPSPNPISNPNQLREPLRLVASYYAYHAEGAMGGENNLSYWTSFRSRLNNLSVSDARTLTLSLTLSLTLALTLTLT